MRKLLAVVLLGAAGLAGAAWAFDFGWGRAPAETAYRTQAVDRGAIVATVNSTGTISPIATVIIGSQLSGQVVEILADFNTEVKTGQVMARLASDQIRARLDAARADLAQARALKSVQEAQVEKLKADLERLAATRLDALAQQKRAEAQLADAERQLQRQEELQRRGFAATAARDTARTQRDTQASALDSAKALIAAADAQEKSTRADQEILKAQIASAEAVIQQRAAIVRQIEVDLSNTEIKASVDGTVVQRNVELGQTVAASLQAPTLFQIAQDLRNMEILANVDESDVGRIAPGQPVTFTVTAFPGREFTGRVKLVRLGSQTVQNVVIYTAVVSIDNSRLELKPGMTANLRIITDRRDDVMRISNAALRWRPPGTGPETPPAAQESPGQEPAARGPGGERPRGGRNPMGEMIERLKGELKLTADQAAEVDRIVAEIRTAIPRGTDGTPEQRRARFQQIRQDMFQKIAAILTPEQKTQLEALGAELGPRRASRDGQPGRLYGIDADGKPKPLRVRLGVTDGTVTEIVSGEVTPGAEVITGTRAAGPASAAPRPTPRRFGF